MNLRSSRGNKLINYRCPHCGGALKGLRREEYAKAFPENVDEGGYPLAWSPPIGQHFQGKNPYCILCQRTCDCGKSPSDLPLYFHSVTHYVEDENGYGDEAVEDHMYPGCKKCGRTFCTCGRQHSLTNREAIYMLEGER